MNERKCDRCGNPVADHAPRLGFGMVVLDACVGCLNGFRQFWEAYASAARLPPWPK